MDVNFFGPLNLIQAVLPQMRSQHSGTIVSISSGAAINPRPSMVMYGASKFALEGLSQGLAVEVESFGIRVLIVQPGAFTTNMPNDVDKGCQGIFEVVTGTGRGAGKEGYLRLPLSADISQRTLDQVKRLEEGRVAFKDIWEHTAHDGGEMKAFPPKR
jgi:NAD(P)-dependent dehydrogenase (short-subunit alcohol dehydrogenase family)